MPSNAANPHFSTVNRKSKIANSTVLVLRFSALGDVAMSATVVRAFALAYPNHRFIMASAPLPEPLFAGIPNLRFEGINTKAYEGVWGIFRLYGRLRRLRPTIVLDLHQVVRTHLLCTLFFLLGATPVFGVKKLRRRRYLLTRAKRKRLQPLPSMIDKYIDVFVRSGFPPISVDATLLPAAIHLCSTRSVSRSPSDILRSSSTLPPPTPPEWRQAGFLIGIAPFAKHPTKEWSVKKMEGVVEQLSLSGKYRIFLFGGGALERAILKRWEQRYANTICVAGATDFTGELSLIGNMHLFVSMDSANMHLASFMGVPALSIWGGTHPYAGFYGWRQAPENAIQIDMPCRPCSVYGRKSCRIGTLACLQSISVEGVLQRIENFFAPQTS